MKLLLTLFALSGVFAQAETPTRCYPFTIPSPEREQSPRTERWCYRQLPEGDTYIFNADASAVKPELALLRSAEGTLTQASLGAGQLRYLKVAAPDFNPLSVPLEEPRGRLASLPPEELHPSAEAVLDQLRHSAVPPGLAETVPLAASSSYLPWRGYWWPRKGMPMLKPLGAFDAFVGARGTRPQAVAWEQEKHKWKGVWWEGHCNGWAAAAILRPEPQIARVDGLSRQTFPVSYLKGIASEADYCAPAAFYGFRERDRSGVSPKEFHQALLYYIGQFRKPIAFNIRSDGPVDNRVISGYAMEIGRSTNGYDVKTKLTYHEYDAKASDEPGVAKVKEITYRYRFALDARGNPTGDGTWRSSKRPGFVWVPLSPGGKCRNGNPFVDLPTVQAILGN